MDDQLEDIINDIREDSFKRTHMYDTLCSDKEKMLYLGFTIFSRLLAVYILFDLKENSGWVFTNDF
jgi:hypothetical protein